MARDYDSVVTEAASNLRLDTSVPAQLALVEGWLNDVIEDMHGRHDWYWTLDRQLLQTVVDKTAGTVAVTASGSTVTGTSTAFASSDIGSFIQFQGSNDWYKITAVASSTSLTIEAGYNGTSALTAGTYIIRKMFYSVSNAEKVISAKQAQTSKDLICLSHKDFDTFLTFSDTTGKANLFCLYGVDSSNNLQVSIHPHADEAFNIELKVKRLATEDSITKIPPKYIPVLLDGVYARGLQYVALGQPSFDRNLIRLKQQDYEMGIARMIGGSDPDADYHPVLMNRDVQNSLPVPRLPDTLSIPQD